MNEPTPRYSCFVPGCPGEHPHKYGVCARPSKEQLIEPAEKMALGLRSILAATDKGALYENRALHLAAGEALGLEGYSSED